jgi:proline dehydrogenase
VSGPQGKVKQLLDRGMISVLPLVPRTIVRRVASRYVAGETLDDALAVVAQLNAEGALATLDLLGEEVNQLSVAEVAVAEYEQMLAAIASRGLDCNISLKLTQLGLELDLEVCARNVVRIAEVAAKYGSFVRIDMEDHTCTDRTLEIYERAQSKFGNLGLVLQSMLFRTATDAEALVKDKSNVRLCKGIYREPVHLAHQQPEAIRGSFRSALRVLLAGGCYVGIATHDEALVCSAKATIAELGLGQQEYEFQMLLGVTLDLRRQLIAEGHRLRVYVPYGRDWYAYSMRRLRENPTVGWHIVRETLGLH